ncbi:MAG: hypothetical protein ACRDHW_15555, partial [Ktedonobacteraceae bacterium]
YDCIREKPGRDHYYLLFDTGECCVHMTPDDNTLGYSPEIRTRLVSALRGLGKVEEHLVER